MTQSIALMDADVAPLTGAHDPFVRGPFPVGVRTIQALGGWTALAATHTDPRIRATVALSPGGGSRPKPDMFRGDLASELAARGVEAIVHCAQ